jgi:hypothetical protein
MQLIIKFYLENHNFDFFQKKSPKILNNLLLYLTVLMCFFFLLLAILLSNITDTRNFITMFAFEGNRDDD